MIFKSIMNKNNNIEEIKYDTNYFIDSGYFFYFFHDRIINKKFILILEFVFLIILSENIRILIK